jgi:hypothetical protein
MSTLETGSPFLLETGSPLIFLKLAVHIVWSKAVHDDNSILKTSSPYSENRQSMSILETGSPFIFLKFAVHVVWS